MHKFWYHSTVRFYKTTDELVDMTNPQNTQYYGENAPFPLELGVFHRFLIPNIDNTIGSGELTLWVGSTQIPCQFGVFAGKLSRVTFIYNGEVRGNLEIKQGGVTIFYSNCVRFMDSTDAEGRKFIRIATKHYYNRNLFSYDGTNFDWIITSFPAYCLGDFSVSTDVQNSRTGLGGSLRVREAFTDESVNYQLLSKGDSNILSFLQVHATNTDFYVDGTKRTLLESIDAEERNMYATMKLTNQKDAFGLNIILDESLIFADVLVPVLGNNAMTEIYVYGANDDYAIPTN